MNLEGLANIKRAIGTLNPNQVRELSERQVRVALYAANQDAYDRVEGFFLSDLSPRRRQESAVLLTRAPISPSAGPIDLTVYDETVPAPPGSLTFHADHPDQFVENTLAAYPNFGVGLAKSFLPFRRPVVRSIITKAARENTMFSISTALPDVIPSPIELPWAVAEFASDTAFLTMNQVRMAFLIAAASDREVGYLEQKSEIATVVGSAFGWRALARQLVGKIPFGGGLVAKAAVAYAGTKVLGLSLDHLYSIGFTYTREERDRLYADAFRQGKKVAFGILRQFRPDLAEKYAAKSADRVAGGPAAFHAER